MNLRKNVLLVILLLSFTPFVYAQKAATASGLYSLPFQTKEEIEDFLRSAKIIQDRFVGEGVTNPHKLLLDNGKIQAYAIWKNIDERRFGITQLQNGPEVDFKDSWKFEVAAYELDKLIGLNMIPVTVQRNHNGQKGSLQIWIPNSMKEEDRLKKNLRPPDPVAWRQKTSKVYLFDALIYNIDRNQGNLLVAPDWTLYMIDHSRTFKSMDALNPKEPLTYFSRSLIDGMRKLDKNALTEHCGKYLMSTEIDSVLKRRDLLVQLYDKLSNEKGAAISYP